MTMADDERCRIDKWLWAARFFKTRSLSAQAVDGGKVRLNGERTKPAKELKVGDRVLVQIGDHSWDVEVRILGTQRGPAPVARTLYEEMPESAAARAERIANRKLWQDPAGDLHGRPTKRDRRSLDDWREN